MSAQLPDGWATASLGELTEPRVDQSGPPSGQSSFVYIDIGSVDISTKAVGEARVVPTTESPSRARQRVAVDDVLVSMTRPNLNGVARVPANLDGAVCSTGFHVLRATTGIDAGWLYAAVRSHGFVASMTAKVQGALYPAIRPDDVRSFRIGLPPLNEQRRIVAKLDAIFEQTRAARARLERMPTLLDKLKRALLSAAFRGDLTADWRTAHPNVTPASNVLDRIRSEYRASVERKLKGANAKTSPADFSPQDEDNLPSIPATWTWAGLSEVAELQLGQRRAPEYRGEDEYQYIRAANITWRGLDLSDVKTMGFVDTERLFLRPGDVLLNEASGSPTEVGKPALWRGEIDNCCFQATVLRLRPNSSAVMPEWVYFSSLADALLGRIAAMAPGIGILHLTAERMRRWPIPLPPLDEQRVLVKILSEALARVYALEDRANGFERTVEKLELGALDKAFGGELVPQDPNDEPASELLARLKAQPASAPTKPPRQGRKSQGTSKMSTNDKDAVKSAILKLKAERFSFDDLRAQLPADYETLKAALFELLEEPNPIVRQVFDKKAKAMQLERLRP